MRKTHVAAFLAGVVAATAVGAVAAPRSGSARRQKKFEKLDVFARVLSYVENNYVEEIDEQKLVYGAVKGMMRTLDPHSAFMTPDEFNDMRADTDGEFGGVGIEIDDDDGVLVVVEPLPDSPAARAGLLKGDRIVAIGGKPTKGHGGDDSAGALRGKPGTTVEISVERKGWDKPKSFTLTREIIRVRAVEALLLESGVGYIRIKQFQERTDQEVLAALEQLKKQSGGKLDGLVLDLRGNPGGLLDQSVRVADLFLEAGVIVSTVGRGGKKLEEETAHDSGTWTGFPIVCLVNGNSASASEIVAGALQDHERALILGTQSFGKGSVQSVIPLEDGSGLKLTIARYYTPSGRSIQNLGITPDMIVEQLDQAELDKARVKEDGQREADLDNHLQQSQRNQDKNNKKHQKGDRRGDLQGQQQQNGQQGEAVDTIKSVVAQDYQLRVAYQTLLSYRKFQKKGSGRQVSQASRQARSNDASHEPAALTVSAGER